MSSTKSVISRSDVGDLILFEPSDDNDVLNWQVNQRTNLSCSEMIEEIVRFQREFQELTDADTETIRKRFRQEYAKINTDPGELQDTEDFLKLLDYLEEFYSSEEARTVKFPLLEESIIREGHKISTNKNNKSLSKPGEFSTSTRMTTYKGKVYCYQTPPDNDMTKAVSLLLDRFNSLYTASLQINDPVEQLNSLFKTIAWFLFEILDLHPFGNGNGRIFRALCSYFLTPNSITPFYSPIYLHHCITADDNNDHSQCEQPCKDVYEQALWDTHEIEDSKSRKPRKILSLIIFCNWKTWKDFLSEIKKQLNIEKMN